jgi:hypothetical protein
VDGVKRSEWLTLVDVAVDLRGRLDGGGYYCDAEEAAYENGKDAAYESAAEDLMHALGDMVTEEDVELCQSEEVFVGSFGRRKHPHAAGSRPMSDIFGKPYGCEVCVEPAKT